MGARILCVAEKPSIAKAVANHLGGSVPARNVPGLAWLKNYEFEYSFDPPWGRCNVVMTSVAGHLIKTEFDSRYRSWNSCNPAELFDAGLTKFVEGDNKAIAKNIETQARYCSKLFIWTDCDREGEYIGAEIRDVARKIKPGIEVMRAKFSNIERAHIIQAARRPIPLDEKQANAVAARIELDLRTGSSFTRLQTQSLKPIIDHVQDVGIISYGSCQFPTLGFVVDRYFRVKNFKPETFWSIKVMHKKDGVNVNFHWQRVHLFDRMVVVVLYERCLQTKTAKVTKMQRKPTSKWKPLPLTTVELQKMGSRFLRMDSQRVMKVAEELYQKGWISYPRTETDQFDRGMDLKAIIQRQTQDGTWGPFAQGLLSGSFNQPRSGRNNDQAHPPIHPVNYVTRDRLNDDEKRVYEFVVRRFLACCSEDAKGESTTVEVDYGGEDFHATGLIVLQRNYLDVYPYDKWESSQQLPPFTVGETFLPTEAKVTEGKTTPPGYLTEPELIALMDANGIGTDATMAEHIAKIKERAYVMTRPRGSGGATMDGVTDGDDEALGRGTRGGRGGRGRGRGGRGGATLGVRGRTTGVEELIPTTLGVALMEGYNTIGFETSLSKPFLRKEMELKLKAICAGTATKNDVVQESLEQYRAVFARTNQQMGMLKAAVRRYVLGENG
ncbi:DNA topoisomerase [Viridothelium virens]|uniref:DNA topoisomerase n=1 Tax=Viridothelium virens TaxID=1048519 RepID=A0A6A6HGL4_VIRVR|nr:DNA topoisomerase [Viridothelium virens]